MSSPTRIDAELFARAQAASRNQDRSAAQQINHWVRLGAALEDAHISQRAVTDVLAGRRRYDELASPFDQAAVRVEWDERLDAERESLDLAAAFAAEGRRQWVDADQHGNPVEVVLDEAEGSDSGSDPGE